MKIPTRFLPDKILHGLLLTLAYLSGVAGIAASGGGGGGGDGGNGISYAGNTDPAAITRSNANRLLGNVLAGQVLVESSSGGTVPRPETSIDTRSSGINLAALPGRLVQNFRETMQSRPDAVSRPSSLRARTDLDETAPCDNIGGSVHFTGFIEDDGTGTLTLDYINCRDDDVTLDGEITATIRDFDFGFLIPVDAIYSFSAMTLTSPTINVSFSGSIHSQIDVFDQSERLTVDEFVARDDDTGEMIMIRNQLSILEYDNIFSPSSISESVSGRIYDSTYGYVDFSTIVAFTFGSFGQEYPDDGQMILTGSLDSAIRVRVISTTHTVVDLDLDGDTNFEITFTLSWSEIEAETDLVDSDGDGMHDSFEQANGLNPLDAADAAQDRDGDGFTNYQEYSKGTDIDDIGSVPDSADISVEIYTTTAAVRVNDDFRYLVAVKNRGPDTSPNTLVDIDLPASVAFVSISPGSAWSCADLGSTVTCTSDAINFRAGNEDTFDLTVSAPSVSGDISIEVSVTPEVIDPNPADNGATLITPVALSTTAIQSQIDAANPGDTVLVAAGHYLGCLDFGGKDVNLQSIGGAADTTLGAYDCGPVVSIGPDGSIDGFRITDFTTSGLVGYGPGIRVSGPGSSISRNIFEDNNERISTSGTAIEGNSASPTIERNIFRNIGCDDQFTSGTISFVNSSEPAIVNNVFENNRCRGINLSLPNGNAPQVINNTLVGNDVGIRVDRRVPQVTQIYRNNLIVNNGIGLEVEFGTDADNPVWENNLVFGNTIDYDGTGDQTGVNGNLSGDPLFVDAAAGNYRLQAGSPAIDSGSSVAAPAIDFDGTARPLDGDGIAGPAVDMGAFEAPAL